MSTLEISQLLGNYGEFVGAIAIVVTLIYLAVQLKQNTASQKANAYQTWVASNLALNAAGNSQSESLGKGISDAKNLDESSWIGFGTWNMSVFQMIQGTNYLFEMGVIDRELWATEMTRGASHLSHPGVRQWWDAGGKTQLEPRFVEALEVTEPSATLWLWDAEDGFVGWRSD